MRSSQRSANPAAPETRDRAAQVGLAAARFSCRESLARSLSN
jgi:hypothetical protein